MAKQVQDERFTYTTAGGKVVNLTPVPPLQAQMVRGAAEKEAIKLYGEAKKPTYTTPQDETFEHDATSLETDEDKAAWLEYQRIQAAIDAHISEKMLRFFLYHGVDAKPLDGDQWESEQKYFGIEVPDDPIERKIHYIQSELIFAASDIQGITTKLLELAGVRPEVVEAAAATFRG